MVQKRRPGRPRKEPEPEPQPESERPVDKEPTKVLYVEKEPTKVLYGVYWHELGRTIRVGRELLNPMAGRDGGTTAPSAVTKLCRMKDGRPDEHGSDLHIETKDGRTNDLVNMSLIYCYQTDPLEVPLNLDEIERLGHRAYSFEVLGALKGPKKAEYELLHARAVRHGQIKAARPITDRLRHDAEMQAAQQRAAGRFDTQADMEADHARADAASQVQHCR